MLQQPLHFLRLVRRVSNSQDNASFNTLRMYDIESESSYTSYEPQSSPKSLLRPPLDPTDEAYLRVHTGNPLTTQNVNPSMEKRQEDSSNKSSERAERLAAGGFLDIGPARTFSSGGPTTRSATSQGKAPGSLNTSALPSQTRKDRIQHDEHSAEGHPKDEMFDDFPAARRFKHVETEDGAWFPAGSLRELMPIHRTSPDSWSRGEIGAMRRRGTAIRISSLLQLTRFGVAHTRSWRRSSIWRAHCTRRRRRERHTHCSPGI